MNRNILILFMSWLGVTGYGQATSPNETPITIARQGSFAVGGTVLHRPGKYDNSRFINWSTQGNYFHRNIAANHHRSRTRVARFILRTPCRHIG